MVTDEELRKAKEAQPVGDERNPKDIYNRYLESRQKPVFRYRFALALSLVVLIAAVVAGTITVGIKISKDNGRNFGENKTGTSNEVDNTQKTKTDINVETNEPTQTEVSVNTDDETKTNLVSEYEKIQEERRKQYKATNKNYYSSRLKEDSIDCEEDLIDEVNNIYQNDLDDIDEYFEVKLILNNPLLEDEVIILKKSEWFYPSIKNKDGIFINYQTNKYLCGWLVTDSNGESTYLDEPKQIYEDCIYEAYLVERLTFESDMITFSYVIDYNNEIKILSGSVADEKNMGDDNTLKMPDEINGRKITKITGSAFAPITSSINGVVVDEGNETISKIVLPKYLEFIGDEAFNNFAKLREVVVGEYLERMSGCSFQDCKNLTKITISELNTNYVLDDNNMIDLNSMTLIKSLSSTYIPSEIKTISKYAFSNNSIVTTLDLSNVTKIESYAFYNCTNLESINNIDNVYSIGDCAFYGCCNLMELNITNNMNYLGNYPFAFCKKLDITSTNERYVLLGDALVDLEKEEIIFGFGKNIPEVKYIGPFAYSGITKISSVTLPNSIIEIKHYAFSDCTNLKEITFNYDLKSIGDKAFSNCINLITVNFNPYISYIGSGAFENCEKMETFVCPSEWTKIADYAFKDNTGLKTVVLPSSIEEIGNSAFWGCSKLEKVVGLEHIKVFGTNCFHGCNFKELELGFDVETRIEGGAFNVNDNLKLVRLGKKISWIGTYAFGGYSSIILFEGDRSEYNLDARWNFDSDRPYFFNVDESFIFDDLYLYLDNGDDITLLKYFGNEVVITLQNEYNGKPITKLGDYSFNRVSNLKKIILNEDLIEIGVKCFSFSALENIVFNEKIQIIDNYAFSGTHIKEMTLPSTITYLGKWVFYKCDELIKLDLGDGKIELKECLISFCDKLKYIDLGTNSVFTKDNFLTNCPNVIYVRFHSGMGKIPNWQLDGDVKYVVLSENYFASYGSYSTWVNAVFFFDENYNKEDFSGIILNGNIVPKVYFASEWEYVDGIPTVIE